MPSCHPLGFAGSKLSPALGGDCMKLFTSDCCLQEGGGLGGGEQAKPQEDWGTHYLHQPAAGLAVSTMWLCMQLCRQRRSVERRAEGLGELPCAAVFEA